MSRGFLFTLILIMLLVTIFSINNVALLLLTPSPSTLTQKFDASQVGLAWAVSVSVTVSTVLTVLSTVEAVRLGVLLATLERIVQVG